ncbi:hypothetical protein HGM15179_001923 [Zosterops borbonicus]|uniref:C2H2-type domain-containing protein n=1 Tax=Zosterops borbonicus TaxID=364589 RepID=A0A8K1GWB6_9PASS|nr:hypothetical protein HGM15179_001923 [Zosterops borbonicus]
MKNHLWLHTGDWPFMCKHCLMTFMQGLAPAYHTKRKNAEGSQLFCCLYCSMAFCSLGALQSHVTSQHLTQTDSTFICELCGELFPSQGKLEGHPSTENPKVTQTLHQGAAEHTISFDDANLVMLPKSQAASMSQVNLGTGEVK